MTHHNQTISPKTSPQKPVAQTDARDAASAVSFCGAAVVLLLAEAVLLGLLVSVTNDVTVVGKVVVLIPVVSVVVVVRFVSIVVVVIGGMLLVPDSV